MDDKLKKALELANFQESIALQKRNINSRIEKMRVIFHSNGQFIANIGTIVAINTIIEIKNLTEISKDKSAIFEDINETPVMISDIFEFKKKIVEAYLESLNEKYSSYAKIAKVRSVNQFIED